MTYRDDHQAHRRYHELLSDVRIATPCPARWRDMLGNEQVRHCQDCDRKVYNLSAMKAEAAVRMLEDNDGRKCLRLHRRHDGTVLTTDCPQGLHRRRVRRAITASTVGVLATAFVSALQPEPDGLRARTSMVPAEQRELEAAPPAAKPDREPKPTQPRTHESGWELGF